MFLSEIMISMQNTIDICTFRPNDLALFWNSFQILTPIELILERFIPDELISRIFFSWATQETEFHFRH